MTRWWLILLLALPAHGAPPQLLVAPFQNSGKTTNGSGLETVLQDILIARLSRTTTVLDRQQFNRLLREQKLSVAGLVKPVTAVKTGKILGATHVVLGSFRLADGKVELHVRAVEVTTGATVAAQRLNTPAGDLLNAVDELGTRLLDALHLKTTTAVVLPAADPTPQANLCFLRGVGQFLSGQFDAAQAQFLKARQLNPQHVEAILWGARSYLAQQRYAHAAVDFQRFCQAAPDHPAIGSAGDGLVQCREKLTESEKLLLDNLGGGNSQDEKAK